MPDTHVVSCLHEFCVCSQNPLVTPLFPAARGFKLGGVISWSLSARLATVSIWHRDKHLLTRASFTPLVQCWLLNKALTQISDVYMTNDMSYLGRVLQGRHWCWCNIICERNASLKLQCCAKGSFDMIQLTWSCSRSGIRFSDRLIKIILSPALLE